jgi:hypothetical protein
VTGTNEKTEFLVTGRTVAGGTGTTLLRTDVQTGPFLSQSGVVS